ncbi:hypothetical protein SDC9_147595 [bioreactor metagenome]|uniref:Uncharacterized protein n=1 Tax=bioreactor metagenome TaxID=1076179 RepID=A0A645EET0_9ZZZZ
MDGHGAKIHLHHHQSDHHDDGQQGVIVIGDGADKQRKAGPVVHKGADGGSPRGDGRDNTNRRGGGVDQIGQLRTGDVVAVRHGEHHAAHGEAVKIVVNKNQNTQHNGGELRARPGFNVLLRPAAKGRGAAGAVHQAYYGS